MIRSRTKHFVLMQLLDVGVAIAVIVDVVVGVAAHDLIIVIARDLNATVAITIKTTNTHSDTPIRERYALNRRS